MRTLNSIVFFLFVMVISFSSCSLDRQIFQSMSQNEVTKNEQNEMKAVDTTNEQEPVVMTRYQNVSSYYVLQDKESKQAKAEQLLASKNKSSVHLVKEMSSIQKAISTATKISPKMQRDNETGECRNCGLKSITNALLLYLVANLTIILIGIPFPLFALIGYWSVKNGVLAMKYGSDTQKILGFLGLVMTTLITFGTIYAFVFFWGKMLFK